MSKILASRIKTHIESSIRDVLFTDDCPNDEPKILSRGLVAICLSSISGLAYKDIVKYITDGTKDNGIDGCYYDANKNKLFLVQSKWSTSGTKTIETGDVHKFVQGAYDLLDLDWKKFNSRFSAIAADVTAGLQNDPEIILLVTYNSDEPISSDCTKLFHKFLSENNSDEQEIVSFSAFNLTKLVRALKSSKTGSKTDVDLNLLVGLDVQELALSLATTSSNIADVVMAKRNVGSLTDPSGHYQKIFAGSLDVSKAWQNYKLWKRAQKAVQGLSASKKDREKQLAVHGNRFIENYLFRACKPTHYLVKAPKIHAALVSIIEEHFKDCYLAVLFKNAQKCDVLNRELDKKTL